MLTVEAASQAVLWSALSWADGRARTVRTPGFTLRALADRLQARAVDVEPAVLGLVRDGLLEALRTPETAVFYRLTPAGELHASGYVGSGAS